MSKHLPQPDVRPIDRLLHIMAELRSDHGCPWDREQSIQTLKPFLIEEAYEVLEAIDSGDAQKHRDELGDLLLQVVFHAQLRNEEGAFGFEDVAAAISDKLVRRHPHVFGDTKVSGSGDVLKNWDAIKKGEKAAAAEDTSVLSGVPRAMPSLMKAHEVQKRAARAGFDWDKVEQAFAKIREETEELEKAMVTGDKTHVTEELGDLLFSVVNVSRKLGIQAEEALQGTLAKFTRRFRDVERRIAASGRDMKACTLEELDREWDAVKADERDEGASQID
jgi:tetrapyrrole methylase family protein/MazG family protein